MNQERDPVRSFVGGCLASPVGFTLSSFVLIPLWFYWPFSIESSAAIGPTLLSLGAGIVYALVSGVVTAAGVPRRGSSALALVGLGVVVGVAIGVGVRDAMLDSCLMGTGPQPDWCADRDAPYLALILPTYAAACGVLGLALWLAGALRLGQRTD